jgi:hypothetical protein
MKSIALILLCLCSVQCGNIVEKASSLGATTLVNLINHTGLTSTLANGGKPLLQEYFHFFKEYCSLKLN